MKNLLTLLIVTLLASGAVMAQDAFKDLKNAEKAVKKYTSNTEKGDELTKGMELLKSAFASDEVTAVSKSWITKAKIYKSLANAEFKAKTLDQSGTYVIAAPNAAIEAFDAYQKAMAMTDKKNELKEIQLGMVELENHLNNSAIMSYQEADYEKAFANFERSIKVYDYMKESGKKTRFDEDPKLLSDQYFFTAVSGYYSKNFDGAKPYLEKLYAEGSEEAFVYETLYNINSESNPEKALEYLTKGREIKPDDTGLLFAEINYYLKSGELNKLISKLETAIEKEPENATIYNTLASVYDQLQQKEEDPAKSKEYFDLALENYNTALSKSPESFDAQYSLGALYYNKAAGYVEKLNDLAADLSPAGMKSYDATKVEMDELFKQALPYFEKAETMNANDGNTIIALKEIYARLNNLEKSNEYKAKMDALRK